MRRPTVIMFRYYKLTNTTIRMQYSNLQITLDTKHTSSDGSSILAQLKVDNF